MTRAPALASATAPDPAPHPSSSMRRPDTWPSSRRSALRGQPGSVADGVGVERGAGGAGEGEAGPGHAASVAQPASRCVPWSHDLIRARTAWTGGCGGVETVQDFRRPMTSQMAADRTRDRGHRAASTPDEGRCPVARSRSCSPGTPTAAAPAPAPMGRPTGPSSPRRCAATGWLDAAPPRGPDARTRLGALGGAPAARSGRRRSAWPAATGGRSCASAPREGNPAGVGRRGGRPGRRHPLAGVDGPHGPAGRGVQQPAPARWTSWPPCSTTACRWSGARTATLHVLSDTGDELMVAGSAGLARGRAGGAVRSHPPVVSAAGRRGHAHRPAGGRRLRGRAPRALPGARRRWPSTTTPPSSSCR